MSLSCSERFFSAYSLHDKKYTFDIGKYLNRRMKLKADDEYDVVEA